MAHPMPPIFRTTDIANWSQDMIQIIPSLSRLLRRLQAINLTDATQRFDRIERRITTTNNQYNESMCTSGVLRGEHADAKDEDTKAFTLSLLDGQRLLREELLQDGRKLARIRADLRGLVDALQKDIAARDEALADMENTLAAEPGGVSDNNAETNAGNTAGAVAADNMEGSAEN